MQHLWAPWRMAYIGEEPAPGCIFCIKSAEERDAENFIVHRGTHAFVMLNAFPYNSGHLMVAPYRHTAAFAELSRDELGDLMALAQQSLQALAHAYGPHGYNLGMNLGRIAGAGIADHLHLHVVPRWDGDTNFMPVIADTRVRQRRCETYRWLRAAWETPWPTLAALEALKEECPLHPLSPGPNSHPRRSLATATSQAPSSSSARARRTGRLNWGAVRWPRWQAARPSAAGERPHAPLDLRLQHREVPCLRSERHPQAQPGALPAELQACRPWLDQQLALVRPAVILPPSAFRPPTP